MNESAIQNALLIAGLIKKYREDNISEEELYALFQWRDSHSDNRALFDKLMDSRELENDLEQMEEVAVAFYEERILSRIAGVQDMAVVPDRPVRTWRWLAAAAVAGLILGAFFLLPLTGDKEQFQETVAPVADKIVPGSNKAILTLTDGTQVVLDTASETINEKGNIAIYRQNGKLVYDASHFASSGAVIPGNTIATPRGGQYQVILPDGTTVWLNAASSISFPAVFTGGERRVSVTGEVYFEVAKQFLPGRENTRQRMPFIVEVSSPDNEQDKVEVVVLGTHFNINAYPDEDLVRTTLVEGAVSVNKGKAQVKIMPGEQAGIAAGSYIFSSSRPDLTEVLAWKNGVFKFSNTDITSIMRQISRWYDVDIRYEAGLSSTLFSGGISRKDDVDKLLEILAGDGRVKFSVNGRMITVQPSR